MKRIFIALATVIFALCACGGQEPVDKDPGNTENPGNTEPDEDDPLPDDVLRLFDDETARPGVGEYADYDFIPIRGEYTTSITDFTPYAFSSGEIAPQVGFRMWFICKKGFTASGAGDTYALQNTPMDSYFLGSNRAEVEELLGAGTLLGAGVNNVARAVTTDNRGLFKFPTDADNRLYELSFVTWNVPPTCKCVVNSGPGSYTTMFYLVPGKDNANAPFPSLSCPVRINVEEGSMGEEYDNCITRTFSYASYGTRKLSMQVDIPKNASGKVPFIIYVTGGGWKGGSVDAFKWQSAYMASRGIAGVRIDYSYVRHGANIETGYDEMQMAYDFVCSKADELGLDVLNFGMAGGSAGTTLASYSAMTMPDCKFFIGCNGIYDLVNRIEPSRFPDEAAMPYLSPYTAQQLAALSPINVIPSDPPAVILFHGTADTTISCEQSVNYVDAVRAKGGRGEIHIYADQKHGFFNYGSSVYFEEVMYKMNDFARSILLPE